MPDLSVSMPLVLLFLALVGLVPRLYIVVAGVIVDLVCRPWLSAHLYYAPCHGHSIATLARAARHLVSRCRPIGIDVEMRHEASTHMFFDEYILPSISFLPPPLPFMRSICSSITLSPNQFIKRHLLEIEECFDGYYSLVRTHRGA